jgi:predicted permease
LTDFESELEERMSLRSQIRTWWRAVSRGQELDRQIHEELEFHVRSYAGDLERQGVERSEALRRARAELGSVAAGKEQCRAAWGTRFFDELCADLRFTARMLRKSPGFAVIAIGSLALGIGANTVIFTVAQHMLLDQLSVPHPEQLRLLWWSGPPRGVVEATWGWFDDEPSGDQRSTSFSYPVYQQLRRTNSAMEDLFAFKPLYGQTVSANGHPEALDVEMVSGNYYSALEVRPQLGRGIVEQDDGVPGSGPVAVISDGYWTSHFGRSPEAIGKVILVNTTPMTIVGVNPKGFTGAYSAQGTAAVFVPFSMQPVVAPQGFGGGGKSLLTDTSWWWVLVMGRVRPGVSEQKAAVALNVSFEASIRATIPESKGKRLPRLLLMAGNRGQNPSAEGMSKPIYVLMALSGFVLLLACANLANLLLARAGTRQREISVRLAMGAGHRRIVRQMLTESLLLSLAGGAAGWALAYAVRDAIPRLMANAWMPPAFSSHFDWKIFLFAAGITLLTGIIFGLAPAWESTRVQVSLALKDTGQTTTHRRKWLAGKAIVVTQVALSVLLVVGAGLFVRTLMELERARLGFVPDHLLLFTIEPPQAKYPNAANIPLYQQLDERIKAIPGVESESLTREPLIAHNVSSNTIVPEGTDRKKDGENPSVSMNDVGRDFFATFGIPIISGRGFDATDTETSRKVAVINESLAERYFPHVNPVGRTFERGLHHPERLEIIGVCGDAKYDNLRKDPEPTFYSPYWQEKNGVGEVTFAIKTHMDQRTIVDAVRKTVKSLDDNLPLLGIRTQEEQIAASTQQEHVLAGLTAGFGALALVLASIGIYGILAYSVSRRTNEIGIRMALGANGNQVLGMVLREALWMTAIGLALGLGGAVALGRVISSMLYGLKPWDPLTLMGATGLLVMVALLAGWVPARRAAGVEPMQALRHE